MTSTRLTLMMLPSRGDRDSETVTEMYTCERTERRQEECDYYVTVKASAITELDREETQKQRERERRTPVAAVGSLREEEGTYAGRSTSGQNGSSLRQNGGRDLVRIGFLLFDD